MRLAREVLSNRAQTVWRYLFKPSTCCNARMLTPLIAASCLNREGWIEIVCSRENRKSGRCFVNGTRNASVASDVYLPSAAKSGAPCQKLPRIRHTGTVCLWHDHHATIAASDKQNLPPENRLTGACPHCYSRGHFRFDQPVLSPEVGHVEVFARRALSPPPILLRFHPSTPGRNRVRLWLPLSCRLPHCLACSDFANHAARPEALPPMVCRTRRRSLEVVDDSETV
jgi:hypothetical protein